MKIHITNVYNMQKAAMLSQHKTTEIAKKMGFLEMGLFCYSTDADNDVELGKRLDGVLASVQPGDIVFFQSPSWNSLRYDLRFVRKLKVYPGIKLVIFVHDVIPLMFNSGEENLRKVIEIYNYADLIIVSSQGMLDLLRKYGLTVKKQMTQIVWDYFMDFEVKRPGFFRRMFFSGAPERFPFIDRWIYKTPLILYRDMKQENSDLNIEIRGYQPEQKFLSDLSEGGYGLVWASGEENSYYSLLQPYKVATTLAAGIPVILQKGLVPEEIITKNGLGFVVESLEEADALVQSVTEEEYYKMVSRIAEFNFLIKGGWFTRKMLTDAVMWLLDDNYRPQ